MTLLDRGKDQGASLPLSSGETSPAQRPRRWPDLAQRSDDPRSEHEVLEQLAEIAHRLSEAEDLDELLQLIVDLGADYLDGCDGASLMLIGKNRTISSPAHSSRVAYESDLAQYEADEGPCLDALRDHRVYMIDDLETETRWPEYRARALQLGVRSMLSYRLYAKGQTFGALDFYSKRPHAYSSFSKVIGQVFASHAGVALKGAINEVGLKRAIATRDMIGQAKGIIIERLGLSGGEAFAMLTTISQRQNRPLRDIAQQIVTTGEIPQV
jgi:GAF domain-containing protein